MTDAPEDAVDIVDDEQHADESQEDIGTDDPHAADGEDDSAVFEDDTEIDELPEVGEVDPNEVPILDELEGEDETHG